MRILGIAGFCLVLMLMFAGFFSYSTIAAQERFRYVVGYSDDDALRRVSSAGDVEIVKLIPEIKAIVIYASKNAAERISSIKGVRYVEIDQEARAFQLSSYNDVLWNVKIINATDVWDSYHSSYGWSALGHGVIVAVLDTGIDYRHSELKGKVAWCANTVGPRTYTGSDLRKCLDRNGHGTFVAGIIASTINNVGNAGVAPNVTLYAIKVLNDAGTGTYSDIAEGIILAVKGPDGNEGTGDDAKILSMSLGGSSDSNVLRDAVKWAYNRGAIIVAAAGNEGDGDPNTNNVAYPARYPEVIAVAAMDSNYKVPSWSSDGPEVDVTAPGVNIYSTYKNGGYATLSGTSMATPHVSAVVALIQALRIANNKTPLGFNHVYEALTTTATDIGSQGFDVYSGYGLVDAIAAVNYALNMP